MPSARCPRRRIAALAGIARARGSRRNSRMRRPRIDYDPFAPEIREDPHPVYRRLRDDAPAYYLPRYDAWALSRFEDVWNASSDPAFSSARGTATARLLLREQPLARMLDAVDPPERTRLRSELRRCFRPAAV